MIIALLVVMALLTGCTSTKERLEQRGFEFHGAKLLRVFRF